jgi:hypothetical protein
VSSSPGRTGGRWTVGDPFRHGDSDSIVVSVPRSDPPVWLDDIRLLVTAPGYVPVDIWQPEQLVDEGGQMTVPMVRSRVARTRIIEDGGSVVANGTACVMIVVSGSRTPFRGTTDEEGFLSLSPTGQLHTGPGMVGSIHPPSWSPVLGSTARQDVPLVLRLDGSRGQIYFSKFSWGDHVKGNAELIVPRIVERVTLRVMDAASDQPITGAVTTVAPSIGGGTPMDPWVSATTDAAGEAVLGDLAEGKWAVTVTSTGFAALSADLDVSLGSDPYVLRLSSISQHALRVITPDGHPLDAANVALRSESGHRATGVTNQEGVVTLDVLAEAPYWAFIHTPDRKWQSDRFIPPTVVFGAKEGVVDVIVQPKRSLRVTVLVDEGRRGGARLLGTRSGAFDERLGPAYGLTNAKGEATLTVPGTPMTVQAIVADRMPGSAEWDGVTTTLDLRLDNLGTRVRGKLRSLDQGFAIRATLLRPEGVDAASRMNWTDHVVTATADAEGTFEFTSLCPGDWEFAVVGTDGATKLRTANLQVSGAVMNCTL